MSVPLAPLTISDLCPIPTLYAKIPDFYAKVPTLYARISAVYARDYIFRFHCAGNVCGRVLLVHIWSVDNDGANAMRRQGREGRGMLVDKTFDQV